MATVSQIFILVDKTAGNLEDLELAGCGFYLSFLTVSDRNKCLAGAGITIAQLKSNYPSIPQNVAIDAEAKNGSRAIWANGATPTTDSYYAGSYDVDSVVDGRITGWLNANSQKWVRCEYDGDALLYDSSGSQITGMPPVGTDVALLGGCAYLMRLSGFVPWDDGTVWGGL